MATITDDKIWAAADEIDAEGKNPTLAAVRDRVGAGSFTTISESMRRWRGKRTAAAAPVIEALPDQLSEVGRSAASQIWTHAIRTAESRLEEAKTELDAQREDLEKERQEAQEFAELLNKQLEMIRSELEIERKRSAQLEEDLVEAREQAALELTSERSRLSEAQQLAATLTGRLEATQAQYDALLTRLDTKISTQKQQGAQA